MALRVRVASRQDSLQEGSSCDVAIGERGQGVDAPSTGGDLLGHLEVPGGEKCYVANTTPCTALPQRGGVRDFSKQVSLPRAQRKSVPRADSPGLRLHPHRRRLPTESRHDGALPTWLQWLGGPLCPALLRPPPPGNAVMVSFPPRPPSEGTVHPEGQRPGGWETEVEDDGVWPELRGGSRHVPGSSGEQGAHSQLRDPEVSADGHRQADRKEAEEVQQAQGSPSAPRAQHTCAHPLTSTYPHRCTHTHAHTCTHIQAQMHTPPHPHTHAARTGLHKTLSGPTWLYGSLLAPRPARASLPPGG